VEKTVAAQATTIDRDFDFSGAVSKFSLHTLYLSLESKDRMLLLALRYRTKWITSR
jgi:hypothetical protein